MTTQSNQDVLLQDEQQFILLLLDRDQQAWRDFVSRYEKLIISRVLTACGEFGVAPRPDIIEECGAEVMAALFQGDMNGLRQFQGRSKLSTWLAVVARRTTLNFLNRQQKQRHNTKPNDSQFDIMMVPERPLKESTTIDQEDRTRLQQSVNQLNKTDRLALMLHFDQKLSYAEIGRELGVSENAVGPRLHRAQQRLKKLMETKSRQT